MLTRRTLDWTARFPGFAAALAKLRARSAYLDGEVAVLDDIGVSDFGALQEALSERRAGGFVYFVFDLLHLDGRDLS
jgi:bifunctional non-homologous end joining protein LigD